MLGRPFDSTFIPDFAAGIKSVAKGSLFEFNFVNQVSALTDPAVSPFPNKSRPFCFQLGFPVPSHWQI